MNGVIQLEEISMTMQTSRWVCLASALMFVLTASARAQTSETVLHNFYWTQGNTIFPDELFLGPDAIYGTTYQGGSDSVGGCGGGCGSAYKLGFDGQFAQLHAFSISDGMNPYGVVLGPSGNRYGTASRGGAYGGGVIYLLAPSGTETIVHDFGAVGDGRNPTAPLLRSPAGDLYGTTELGGCCEDGGVIFRLTHTGVYTVLYHFTRGLDGGQPTAGVIADPDGNLYGTAWNDGLYRYGVIYELSAAGYQVLYSFTGGADGGEPVFGVTRDGAGNLYGTNDGNGATNQGVVYKLDPAGDFTVLHTFTGPDGAQPASGVILDAAGNLYGTTYQGGPGGGGVVYQIDAAGTFQVLFAFTTAAGGLSPGPIVLNPAGDLIGTTQLGGQYRKGTVYVLKNIGAR